MLSSNNLENLQDSPYLRPYVNQVAQEDAERAYWDTVEATPARK